MNGLNTNTFIRYPIQPHLVIIEPDNDVRAIVTLLNSLHIKTTTGDITLLLHFAPPGVLKASAIPSVHPRITLESTTGSIIVTTQVLRTDSVNDIPAATIPSNPWSKLEVKIGAQTGDVRAILPQGNLTEIRTYTGGVALNLHPIPEITGSGGCDAKGKVDGNSSVIVKTISGPIQYRLFPALRPYQAIQQPTSALTTSATQPPKPSRVIKHSVATSTCMMRIYFPQEWEGKIFAHLRTGDLKSKWPNTTFVRDREIRHGVKCSAGAGQGIGKIESEGGNTLELLSETGDAELSVLE